MSKIFSRPDGPARASRNVFRFKAREGIREEIEGQVVYINILLFTPDFPDADYPDTENRYLVATLGFVAGLGVGLVTSKKWFPRIARGGGKGLHGLSGV